jgi:hypothetical protein
VVHCLDLISCWPKIFLDFVSVLSIRGQVFPSPFFLTWQICRLGFPSASALLIFAAMFPVILSFPARVSVLHLISSPAQQLFCTDFWAAAILSVRLFSNPHEQAASGDLFFGLSFQSRYKFSVPLLCPRVRLFP